MAEAIVSTILEQLTAITIDKASEAWRLVRGVEKEVKRLESNFKAIQYELEDAEEKQYVDKRLKPWLERFKQVSYDMEDVLDDWKTAVQKLQKADHGVGTSATVPKRKLCPFVSWFSFGSKVVSRHEIATRIKDINEELDEIVKDKDKLELVKREIIQLPKRPESTSFVDASKLYGRDDVKEDIIRTLLCGTSEEEEAISVPTVTIVGMGGIGKTALAQLIYNDPRIQTHFDKKIWVCVSDPFDPSQIARAILEGLDLSLQNTTPLQTLLSKISENIKEKKLFLVLDDVWADHGQDWEQLKATFQSFMLGSRILVTTRKDSVLNHLESSHVFHLDLLSEEICWLILYQKAFTGRKRIGCDNLEDIGREIAKKCKGLPLAATTLGGLLQGKLRREEWQNVLNSEMWRSNFEQYIYAPLLLSCFDLPSAIRRCFLYCAIFPKDYVIGKDELVQHWMAQGYLNSVDNLGAELEGEHHFKCLASHSFFQDFDKDTNGDVIRCKMHDMVHDFVQFLTKCEFITEKIDEDLTLDLSSKNPRHLRLVIENCSSSPMSIYGTEKLRSLVAVYHVKTAFGKIASEAPHNLLSGSQHLRLLELCSFCLDAKGIARDMGNLIHLRYLCLKGCNGIETLLETVCELPNLQSLNIEYCSDLKKLPVGIEKLINLRYLCTKGCYELTYYPKGISNLTSLMRLSNIKLRADCNDPHRFSIGDLENLDLLGGNLCVELRGNSIDQEEAKRAKLHKKTHLKQMEIWICSPHIKKEEVVQALNPPSN
ncbi:putative disease resistance protein RGA3 [Durio zibethinus]|uniref:Disease resistance protein RGA3 n=1 Tax=Durio zibethinus TaxID=66656 RepID=A0A6P5YU26_DURZI|nr:putative disease resistance protein RGA3 [Durio zibethinus]